MKTLNFSIDIDAPKQKVWDKLWSDSGYRQWTSAFAEGSYAESDWEQGSKIVFLTPKGEGMFGVIEEKVPFERMTFKHLGEIKDGVEEPKDWGEALESYQLDELNGKTKLNVNVNLLPEFHEYFNATFPKALSLVKQISEQ